MNKLELYKKIAERLEEEIKDVDNEIHENSLVFEMRMSQEILREIQEFVSKRIEELENE